MSTATQIRRHVALALAFAFTGLIATAGATFAATTSVSSPNYGVKASCMYKSTSVDGKSGFRLKRIVVEPPTSFFGSSTDQVVGWRIVVQRSYPNNDGPTPVTQWKGVFVSAVQKSLGSPDQAAAFTAMTARIGFISFFDAYPNGHRMWLRTIVKFYRYAPDGSVDTQSRYKVPHFDLIRDGGYFTTQYGVCDGAWLDSTTGGPPEPH
jgi:hypothetical protein